LSATVYTIHVLFFEIYLGLSFLNYTHCHQAVSLVVKNWILISFTGNLNVYLNKTLGGPTLVWTVSGAQQSGWQQGQIPIAPILSIYTVYFEGIRGSSFNGDIALDDIDFQPVSCGCK